MKSTRVRRVVLGDNGELHCDIIKKRDGRLSYQLYPIAPKVFWRTHTCIDLTERELREILGVQQED